MGRIKCLKLECSVCHNEGLAQLFLNKNGEVRYARVRHFTHRDATTKKPQFTYCKIENLEAMKTLLSQQGISLSSNKADNGQAGQRSNAEIHDLEKLKIISFHENNVKRSSSSWLGHKPSKLAIPGSNPGDRTNKCLYLMNPSYSLNCKVRIALLIVLSGFQMFLRD